MRQFVVSELWGPLTCEVCHKNEAYTIVLSNEENKTLPEKYGPIAVRFIFDKKLGVVKCNQCLK